MEKKVKIIAYYTSTLGETQQREWEKDNMADAKEFVESMSCNTEPVYTVTPSKIEEDGWEYDMTTITEFRYSHSTIIDYTDGRKIEKEDNSINE